MADDIYIKLVRNEKKNAAEQPDWVGPPNEESPPDKDSALLSRARYPRPTFSRNESLSLISLSIFSEIFFLLPIRFNSDTNSRLSFILISVI